MSNCIYQLHRSTYFFSMDSVLRCSRSFHHQWGLSYRCWCFWNSAGIIGVTTLVMNSEYSQTLIRISLKILVQNVYSKFWHQAKEPILLSWQKLSIFCVAQNLLEICEKSSWTNWSWIAGTAMYLTPHHDVQFSTLWVRRNFSVKNTKFVDLLSIWKIIKISFFQWQIIARLWRFLTWFFEHDGKY